MRDPLIGIFPGLAHPDRHVIAFAEINVLPYYALIRRRPIFVESVCGVRIERLAEDGEVSVPLRATKKENVVGINLSYFPRQLLVERFKRKIQRRQPGEMRNRLIEQVVSEHGRLITIVRRQPPPDRDQVLLLLRTLVKPRISGAVIDVRTRLSARCGVQVKDHI